MGLCRSVPQILALFRTKNVILGLPSKIYTRFQTYTQALLRLERHQKDFFKAISNSHIIFLSISFGIETTNTFIHFRSSLEYHPRSQTKNGQRLYPFSDQNGAITPPYGAAHTYGVYKGVPPRPEEKTWRINKRIVALINK